MKPLFVDLGGSTFRIDPPRNTTSYVKIQLTSETQLDDAGNITLSPNVIELWISRENVKQLSEALQQSIEVENA